MRRLGFAAAILALVAVALPTPLTPQVKATIRPPSVSGGLLHSCGVTGAGAVVCWGDNSEGQSTPPAGVFATVTAGYYHTCALSKTTGGIVCWGKDDEGQASPPAGTFKSVTAGAYHTCAIKSDDTVACWGRATNGQIDAPTGTFKSVSAGYYHNCAVKSDDTIACWGQDSNGQTAAPSGTFKAVSAGGFHTCALATDATLDCWGYDFYGQSTPPAGTYKAVAAGGNHNCAIEPDDTLTCWGRNTELQATPPDGTFALVEGGSSNTCAIATSGIVSCWGGDDHGQTTIPTVLSVAGLTSPQTAGTSGSFIVRAVDLFGAPRTGYTGTIHFTSTDAGASLPADHTLTAVDAGAHLFSLTFRTAGAQAVRARDTVTSSITGLQKNVAVNPAPIAALAVSGVADPTAAGGTNAVSVVAVDAYGNRIPNYAGTVHFTSTDPHAVLPADHTFAAGDKGAHNFLVTFRTAGEQAIRARDTATASITGLQEHITVRAGAAASLVVAGIADPYMAGGPDGFTVTAKDAYGNTATGYTGTVHFTSTDGHAILPADHPFMAGDAGVHSFNVTLTTVGEQAVRARDTAGASVTGVQEHITVHT